MSGIVGRAWKFLFATLAGIGAGLAAKKIAMDPPKLPEPEFIPAKHFRDAARTSVDWIVLHSTENACGPGVARAVAEFFRTQTDVTSSAHYVVGPDAIYRCVKDEDVAWHAPGANDRGIGVEIVGKASYTREQWEACKVLPPAESLVSVLCDRWNVPAKFVDAAGLLRGERGITTHNEVRKAWHKSDHTDPGAGFPLEDFIAHVMGARSVA